MSAPARRPLREAKPHLGKMLDKLDVAVKTGLATASGARRFVYAQIVEQLEFDVDNDNLTTGLDPAEERRVRKAAEGALKFLRRRATARKP